MLEWGYFLVLIICLSVAAVNVFVDPIFEDNQRNQPINENNNIVVKVDDIKSHKNVVEQPLNKSLIYQGDLVLIKSQYPVREESVRSDIVKLSKYKELKQGYRLRNTKIELSRDVAQRFSQMVYFAKRDGVRNFTINSGFRGFDEQNRLYKEMGPTIAMPPGYSEHNAGLSLDVGSTKTKMIHAAEGKWIEKNAWRFGFILRYPKDKTEITGIQYEPWHIRYVGLPHSAIMYENNLVLEEYLDYLKEEKVVSVSVNELSYTVYYYHMTQMSSVKLPQNKRYELSGNNIDGIIVTIYEQEMVV
ncbi:M15 family metallopeptidase [Cytobacillus sp. IB215316]|uniref:M15 family metallopeptidase n=1 Tax=Cytobacillus sp. IB215316 TaxID=3097354 RepID=UPI002A109CAD|nr:M15 family metallopeptidase [Cytobacillus sp. IB215316]MDX8363485.1 M15 family metallopeptidase [Cytobacillus sp. IB215316]